VFLVSGRGELHLTILIENMRREGFELASAARAWCSRTIDGVKCEPYELLTVDVEEDHQGGVMEELGAPRRTQDMQPDGKGRVRLEYRIPARGLIGFQGEFLTMTRGTGIWPATCSTTTVRWPAQMAERRNGVLISQNDGEAVAYALWNLQDRGRMFVSPGDALYEGMIIGIHTPRQRSGGQPDQGQAADQRARLGHRRSRAPDPPISLTWNRRSNSSPTTRLVEITPKNIRLRKRHLKEHERKRASRDDS
jgi:GTP-binding protein